MRTILLGCLLLCLQAGAQTVYPKNYFASPLPLPMQLAANFGELRTNHFHMGLDIRTAQRENIPVLAAAEGFVQRIKVERGGYGRAIYVQHPNGFTTLYAHLNLFYPSLEAAVQRKQYETEQWAQDLQFLPGEFVVTNGMQIGLSGNTGGSAGPHLHFEIRDTRTENCLNPLLFYTLVPDKTAPLLKNAYWFQRDRTTCAQVPRLLRQGVVNEVGAAFSTGLNAEDKSNNSPYYFGIYKAAVWLDGQYIQGFTLNNIGYDKTRQMNGCVHYPSWVRRQGNIQHISRLPGVNLGIFDGPVADGIIRLTDQEIHELRIVAEDVNGNKTERSFRVRRSAISTPVSQAKAGTMAGPNVPFVWNQQCVYARFAANAFYDTVAFSSFALGAAPGRLSWQLASETIPVESLYQVVLPMPAGAQPQDKWQVSVQAGGYTQYDMGIPLPGEKIAADSLNRLGILTVEKDNTPPTISLVTATKNALKPGTVLRLRANDTQGEIHFVRVTINGKWHPFAHAKNDAWWALPKSFPPGTHVLRATVADVAGNEAEREFGFRTN